MADLLISRVSPGVVIASSTDPFSSLQVHRVQRSSWKASPDQPGVYLLFGYIDDRPAAYVGMSTTSIRSRISQHHVTLRKDWFGTLFAVPIASPLLCPAVEAEMIRRIKESGVVDFVDNRATPSAFLDAIDVHVEPAVTAITDALEILLGSDIFSPLEPEPVEVAEIAVVKNFTPLARVYKDAAATPRAHRADDPVGATHGWVGQQIVAWGRFEEPEPDNRFTVLRGSHFRRAVLNEDLARNDLQLTVEKTQQKLADEGVLDLAELIFLKDYTFENWTRYLHCFRKRLLLGRLSLAVD